MNWLCSLSVLSAVIAVDLAFFYLFAKDLNAFFREPNAKHFNLPVAAFMVVTITGFIVLASGKPC